MSKATSRAKTEAWRECEYGRFMPMNWLHGDRIEIRRLQAHSIDPESIDLYAAWQVFVVEREVRPKHSPNIRVG